MLAWLYAEKKTVLHFGVGRRLAFGGVGYTANNSVVNFRRWVGILPLSGGPVESGEQGTRLLQEIRNGCPPNSRRLYIYLYFPINMLQIFFKGRHTQNNVAQIRRLFRFWW